MDASVLLASVDAPVLLAPAHAPFVLFAAVWGSTTTPLDPAHAAGVVLTQLELPFFVDALRCVRDVLRVPLSGDVYALGFSQGAKLASRFGCQGAAASGGELRVRAVASAEGLFVEQGATCASSSSDKAPPPLLFFQSQSDTVVPFCVAGPVYEASAAYWNAWTALGGCVPSSPLLPTNNAESAGTIPPIMQALCTPDAQTLPPAVKAQEMTSAGAARAANATRLLRVYTNGLYWRALLAASLIFARFV